MADRTQDTGYKCSDCGAGVEPIQQRVARWVTEVLGPEGEERGLSPLENRAERCDRFVEEALELAQAIGASRERLHRIVDYVMGRPVGEVHQEVGGSMLTLYAVSESCGVDADAEAKREVQRVETPEIRAKVRRRQQEKRSALGDADGQKRKVVASPEHTGLTSDLACGCGPDRYCVDHRIMAAARDRTSELPLIKSGPDTRWESNGEAGDASEVCNGCDCEDQVPHTWEDCIVRLRAERDKAISRACDLEMRTSEREAIADGISANRREYVMMGAGLGLAKVIADIRAGRFEGETMTHTRQYAEHEGELSDTNPSNFEGGGDSG